MKQPILFFNYPINIQLYFAFYLNKDLGNLQRNRELTVISVCPIAQLL